MSAEIKKKSRLVITKKCFVGWIIYCFVESNRVVISLLKKCLKGG